MSDKEGQKKREAYCFYFVALQRHYDYIMNEMYQNEMHPSTTIRNLVDEAIEARGRRDRDCD